MLFIIRAEIYYKFGYSAKSARSHLLGSVGHSISSGQLIESKQQLMSV